MQRIASARSGTGARAACLPDRRGYDQSRGVGRARSDAQVRAARVFTRLIDERGEKLLPDLKSQAERAAALAAASLLSQDLGQTGSPWNRQDAWTVQGSGAPLIRLQRFDGEPIVLQGASVPPDPAATRVEADRVTVWLDGEPHYFDRVSSSADAKAHAGQGVLRAPMPGVVLAVHVKDGDAVKRGQPLIVMEAMKMEHTLGAGAEGAIAELRVRTGDRVREGDALLTLKDP